MASIDPNPREITLSIFKGMLSEINSENVSEQGFLEKFELALNNIIPDEFETTLPKESQKFRASYQAVNELYKSYKDILGDNMAEFIGVIQPEDESLIIKLMIYNVNTSRKVL